VPSRGQVYFVSLDPIQGREQSGRRPVLVVSTDAINRQPLVVAVIVGTDAANIQRDYPTNIRVTAAESGLPRDTIFRAFRLRARDHSRFNSPVAGALPAKRMEEVANALRMTLEL